MDGRAHSARGPGCSALSCPQPSTSPHAPQAPSQKRDSSLPSPKQGRFFFLFCKNCSAPPAPPWALQSSTRRCLHADPSQRVCMVLSREGGDGGTTRSLRPCTALACRPRPLPAAVKDHACSPDSHPVPLLKTRRLARPHLQAGQRPWPCSSERAGVAEMCRAGSATARPPAGGGGLPQLTSPGFVARDGESTGLSSTGGPPQPVPLGTGLRTLPWQLLLVLRSWVHSQAHLHPGPGGRS